MLWNIREKKKIHTFDIHTDWVISVCFSSDGKLLASCSEDKTIIVWDLAKKSCFFSKNFKNRPISIAFSKDNQLVAVGFKGQSKITLININSQESQDIPLDLGDIWSIKFSSNNLIIASGEKGVIKLSNPLTKPIIQQLKGHNGTVWSIALSNHSNRIASAGDDLSIRIWDLRNNQLVNVFLNCHKAWIRSVAFLQNGQYLASGSEDKTIKIWNIEKTDCNQCTLKLNGYKNWIWSAVFSPDASNIISGSEDNIIRIWKTDSLECCKQLEGHTGRIRSVAFSPDSQLIASGADDSKVNLWIKDSDKPVLNLKGPPNTRILSVALGKKKDKKILVASGCSDKTILIWEISQEKNNFKSSSPISQKGHTDWVRSISLNSDCYFLASGAEDSNVIIWDLKNQNYTTLIGHSKRIWEVAFSPDDKLLASCSDDGKVILWDFQEYKSIFIKTNDDKSKQKWTFKKNKTGNILEDHNNPPTCISFDLSSKLLAIGSSSGFITVWDLENFYKPKTKTTLRYKNRITSINFNNSKELLSSSSDGTMQIWNIDTKTNKVLKIISPYTNMKITNSNLELFQKNSLVELGAIN